MIYLNNLKQCLTFSPLYMGNFLQPYHIGSVQTSKTAALQLNKFIFLFWTFVFPRTQYFLKAEFVLYEAPFIVCRYSVQWNETKRKEVLSTQTQKRNVLDKAEYVVPGDHSNFLPFIFITLVSKLNEVQHLL